MEVYSIPSSGSLLNFLGMALLSKEYSDLVGRHCTLPSLPLLTSLCYYITLKNMPAHVRRCSILLIVREMQTKTTIRFHLTLVKIAIIKKSTDNKCWKGCEKRGIPLHCWCRSQVENNMEVFPKNWKKKRLPYDPTTPLLGIYSERTLSKKDTLPPHPVLVVALFTIAKTCKKPKCPSIVGQIKKRWYIYMMEY